MAFARLLRNLVRDPNVGPLVVPIVADEARTFGLEPIIAESKIYAPEGQRYTPVDAGLPLSYAESRSGQLLEEGITEAGAMAAFTAIATSYATWQKPMLPVYLFYSMFGFQRVGDLTWSLGDARGRGILAGCTAGRTTLLGEGLQHADGHSPLLASVNPACVIYDPAFAYELAIILEDAVKEILDPDARRPLLVHNPLQRELPDATAPRNRCRCHSAGPAIGRGERRSRPTPRRGAKRDTRRCVPVRRLLFDSHQTTPRTVFAKRHSCSRAPHGAPPWMPGRCSRPTGT